MKKLLYLFCTTLLVLVSCSSDDTNPSSSITPILLKKSVFVSDDEFHTAEYTYNGNKIVSSIGDDGYKSTYTYTGDLITKVVGTEKDGTIYVTTEYIYTDGKLSSKTRLRTGDSIKYETKYTHNTDGTISYEEFTVDVATGDEQERGYTGKYTYKDGNLVKKDETHTGFYSSGTLDYDTKNSPLKNVLGLKSILGVSYYSVNNLVKETYYSDPIIYTYTYDVNGFPTEQKIFNNGKSYISTYTY